MIYHNEPLCLAVEVTSHCNMKCSMCGHPKMKREHANMDLELFKKIVDEVAAEEYLFMWMHHMGEPLMYPHICEAIEYAVHVIGRSPCMSTNGMLLDRDMLVDLKAAGLDTIMICLSSMQPNIYDKIRCGGNFGIVKDNIHAALDIGGFTIIVQQLVTIYNPLETTDAYYKEFGETRPGFRVERWPVNKFKPGGAYLGFNEPYNPSCHLLPTHFLICQDGRVPVCCFDYDCTVCAGNVVNQTIKEIANFGFDEIVSKIKRRDFSSLPACENCFDMSWRDALPRTRFVEYWRGM